MNNKEEKHLIWDLDGTLIDSYSIIVRALKEALEEAELFYKEEEILKYVIRHSVRDFIKKIEEENSDKALNIKERYAELNDKRSSEINLIRNAKEVLEELSKGDISNYIYTHKGRITNSVLERLEIRKYFKEVITSENGFLRKPDPEAVIYLMEKYKMNKENTYYIGDRSLDIECAKNAEIKGVLYLENNSYVSKIGKEDYIVSNLIDVLNLVKD